MNRLTSCRFGVKLTEENSGASNGRFSVCVVDWTWLAVGTTSTGALFQKSGGPGGGRRTREFLWLPVFSNNLVTSEVWLNPSAR